MKTKQSRYHNLSLGETFHVIPVSSLTDWHLSVEDSARTYEGWGDTIFVLSLWRADRSNKNSIKSVVFCPAFLQLLRKMDMGYKSHHLFLIYLGYCSVLWFNKGILWVCNKIQISVLHLDSTRNQPYLSFLSFLNFGGMTPHFWRR